MKLIFSLTNDKLSCDWCLYKADENQRIESPFDDKVLNILTWLWLHFSCFISLKVFCSSQCLIRAFNSYLLPESKLDLSRMFPQTDLLPVQYLLPVRLLLLGPGEGKPDPSYGSGLRVDNIDALTSLDSLMTHEARLTSKERLELAVTSLVLAQSLREVGAEVSVLQLARMVLRVRCNAHQVMMMLMIMMMKMMILMAMLMMMMMIKMMVMIMPMMMMR